MNLTLDDLFETCAVCNGAGKVEENPSSPYSSGLIECNACGGYGRGKLTESGQALLDFIRVVKRRGMI